MLAALGLGLPAAAALTLMRPWQADTNYELTPGETLLRRVPDPTAGRPPGHSTRPTNIRSGIVTAMRGDELHVHNDEEDFVILVTPETVRDEGLWVGHLPIEVGDKVMAKGARKGHAFTARELWVNARMWHGPILEILSPAPGEVARIRLRDRYDLSPYHTQEPDGHIVAIHPPTIIAGPFQPPGGNAAFYKVPQGLASERDFTLVAGQHFEVTGREYRGVLIAIRASI